MRLERHACYNSPTPDELIAKYEQLKKRRKYDDWSNIDEGEASELVTAGMAAICRAVGADSQLARQAAKPLRLSLPHLFNGASHTWAVR